MQILIIEMLTWPQGFSCFACTILVLAVVLSIEMLFMIRSDAYSSEYIKSKHRKFFPKRFSGIQKKGDMVVQGLKLSELFENMHFL